MRRFRSLELGLGIKGLTGTTKSKHNNKRTLYNGVTYASKMEAKHAMWLDAECKSPKGMFAWWVRQPKFALGCPENVYIPDFLVVRNGETRPDRIPLVEAHEVKGHRTHKFNRDVKLWRRYGPCPLYIYEYRGLAEVIVPDGEEE